MQENQKYLADDNYYYVLRDANNRGFRGESSDTYNPGEFFYERYNQGGTYRGLVRGAPTTGAKAVDFLTGLKPRIYEKLTEGGSNSSSSSPKSVQIQRPDGTVGVYKEGSKAFNEVTAGGGTVTSGVANSQTSYDSGLPAAPAGPQYGTQEMTDLLLQKARDLGVPGVPTNAGQVTSAMAGVNLPQNSPTFGNIADANASVAGLKTGLDAQQQAEEARMEQANKDRETALKAQEKTKGSILDIFKNTPSAAETREDTFEDIGMDPGNYFADQKARIAEIESLTTEYNNTKAAMENEKLSQVDRLQTTGSISRAQAAIERKYAPTLNRMSANVNAKAATLQALQGNFAEARNFANQAVQDATADVKFKLDSMEVLYNMNQDSINRLDKEYQDALNESRELVVREYENAREDSNFAMELALKYPNAGIRATDSRAEATRKAQPFAAQESSGNFTNTQINNGAANAGMTVEAFRGLDPNVQNFYVNLSSTQQNELKELMSEVRSGETSPEEAQEEIGLWNISEPVKMSLVKQTFIQGVQNQARRNSQPSGWDKVRSWLGI